MVDFCIFLVIADYFFQNEHNKIKAFGIKTFICYCHQQNLALDLQLEYFCAQKCFDLDVFDDGICTFDTPIYTT